MVGKLLLIPIVNNLSCLSYAPPTLHYSEELELLNNFLIDIGGCCDILSRAVSSPNCATSMSLFFPLDLSILVVLH